jgi:hypothetical protein
MVSCVPEVYYSVKMEDLAIGHVWFGVPRTPILCDLGCAIQVVD